MSESRKLPPPDPASAASWRAINRAQEARDPTLDRSTGDSALDQRTVQFVSENCEDFWDRERVVSRILKINDEDREKHTGRPTGIKVNGPKLRKLREAKGMTQPQLAAAVAKQLLTGDCDRKTIRRYEQSERADCAHVEALARVFGVSPTSLWAKFHDVVLIPSRPTVSLTPDSAKFVRSCLASGLYQNGSEVVREGLRLLERELGHSSVAGLDKPPKNS